MNTTILGVHPVKADEPLHLIELSLEGDISKFRMDSITQEVEGQSKMNWQVP